MAFYTKIAMRLLWRYLEPYTHFFSDLKKDLRKSKMRTTIEEYLSTAILTCMLLFTIELPLFAYIFSLLKLGIMFSIFMATTMSIAICSFFFLIFLNYPKFIIRDKARVIETTLPFGGIYLSTIASSGLPPHKIFEIFSKFEEYGELSKEAKTIVKDMQVFGLNIYESLERSIERTPSKEMRDLLWSILSTMRSGGNLAAFLSEKSKTFLNNYRRSLREFSHSLSIFLEIYLTALVLGAIFFTILTSIMSSLGGMIRTTIVSLQFFLIFLFIPLITAAFIILIKSASPGGG